MGKPTTKQDALQLFQVLSSSFGKLDDGGGDDQEEREEESMTVVDAIDKAQAKENLEICTLSLSHSYIYTHTQEMKNWHMCSHQKKKI